MPIFYDVLMEKTASNKMRKMIAIYNYPNLHSEGQVRRAYNYIKSRIPADTDEGRAQLDALLMHGRLHRLATNLRYGGGDDRRHTAYVRRQKESGKLPYLRARPAPAKTGEEFERQVHVERLRRGVRYTSQPPFEVRTPSPAVELPHPDVKVRLDKYRETKARSREEYEAALSRADAKRRAREARDAETYNHSQYNERTREARERARIKRDRGYEQDTSGVEDLGGLVPYLPPTKPQPGPQPRPQPSAQPSPQQESNMRRNLLLAGAGLTTAGGAGYLYHRNKKRRSEQR